jgi:hypothetical protein
MTQEAVAPGRRSRCPICGLQLQVIARGAAPALEYDFQEWSRVCKFPASGGPSMCLAGTAGPVAVAPDPVRSSDDPMEPGPSDKVRL